MLKQTIIHSLFRRLSAEEDAEQQQRQAEKDEDRWEELKERAAYSEQRVARTMKHVVRLRQKALQVCFPIHSQTIRVLIGYIHTSPGKRSSILVQET